MKILQNVFVTLVSFALTMETTKMKKILFGNLPNDGIVHPKMKFCHNLLTLLPFQTLAKDKKRYFEESL